MSVSGKKRATDRTLIIDKLSPTGGSTVFTD